ncbi:hypothetical protein BDV25DRAFT_134875 [Aspergillus avenaceus]|uniref:Uncharacterized protein n=1 Tax=Aspergillus avenaceus TaxID=36643 RepID=A0A5N6TDK1_ASPAV|nr:hypothetical protein BDV25DRAFT_134875 [Aspergillus avenaceus]
MSNLPERPWTEEEKYTLLTEILKKAGVPHNNLVRIIRDLNISPSWADIPLPPGRSLNSCQLAFSRMYSQQHAHLPVNQSLVHYPYLRNETIAPSGAVHDNGPARKRPLFSTNKPTLAPRAIQPRPTTGTTTFSGESGASALTSPGSENMPIRSEPPRKRGRPSKAESERRKAIAEARGETYPPPRRLGSNKLKDPSTPNSPSSFELSATSSMLQASGNRPPNVQQHEPRYLPFTGREPIFEGSSGDEQVRDIPNREAMSTMRGLPRPTETIQILPSPKLPQPGHRKAIARMGPEERPFESLHIDRMSFSDSSQRSIIHPSNRRPNEPPISGPEVLLHTSVEKQGG